MQFPRSSGVLVHITSLPSKFGIGDLGPTAFKFVNWLKDAKQSLWQLLPFSITDGDGCPYSSCSAYGGNPLLISPEELVADKLLKKSELIDAEDIFGDRLQNSLVSEYKTFLFRKSFERFVKRDDLLTQFDDFYKEEKEWLLDLSLYIVISEQFGRNWVKWPDRYRHRDPAALKRFEKINQEQIRFHQFLQFLFFKQWKAFKKYANDNGVKLIGDIPIFLSHQSMDVWKNQELFLLAGGEPYVVTGAPPDNFSVFGQKWGNPNYNWWAMEQDGFKWWIKRIAFNLKYYNIIRLDHFRGFAATWEIPIDNPDPRSGYWSTVPGHNLFHCVGEALGDLPIIAEDLGKITPDVEWLRDRFNFAGMKILQFAFNEGDSNVHLPHNFRTNNCVVYTGTHDNPTSKGWFENMPETLEKHYAAKYAGAWNWHHMNWSLINLALSSRADVAIIPIQDIMDKGNEARMNIPGTAKGNWTWRFRWEELSDANKHHLRELTCHSWRN